MTTPQLNTIANNHGCWLDANNHLYTSEQKPVFLGKIYWKELTGLYHAINAKEKKYKGDKNFEIVLVEFLKGENILKS